MAQIRLEPNRAYPSIPTVGDTLESHRLALEAIVECIATHERRSKNVLDSFVRVGELQDMGLVELEGTASTGPGSSYIVDDDPSEESTSHHHNGTYLRIDGGNSMDLAAPISWKNSANDAVDYLVHQGAAQSVTVEHVYGIIDTSPTPVEVTDDTQFTTIHTVLGAGALTTGNTYLLVAEAMYGAASGATFAEPTDSDVRWRYNGATLAADSTTDRDIDSVGDIGEQIGFAKIVTGAAGASLTFEGKTDASPNNSIKSSHARAMAINLTDLTTANYVAETTVASSVSVAGSEDAYASIGTYTIGDGTSDYILFCNFKAVMTDASAGNVPDFEAWLRVNGGPFSNSEIIKCGGSERTHTGDSYSRVFALAIPAAASATLDFQAAWHSGAGFLITTDGAVNVTLSVIALRLNDFDDYFITSSADLADNSTAGVKERLNTSRTSTAANGNWNFFGGLGTYYPGSGFSCEAEIRLDLNAGGDVAVAGDINTAADNTSANQAAWIPAFPLAATNVNSGDSMEIGLFLDPAPNAVGETWQAGFITGWSHSAQPTVEKFIVGDPGYPIEIDGASAKINTTLNVTGATDLDSTLNVDGIGTFNTDVRVFGNLGAGPDASSPAHVLHLRDATTDTAANEIANFEWLRPSAANNDSLNVLFSLANSVGASVEVGRIKYQIQDITSTLEDGAIIFDVIRAGVLEQVVVMDTDEIIFNDAGADRNFIVKRQGGGTAMQVTGSTGITDFNFDVDINTGGKLTIYDSTDTFNLRMYSDTATKDAVFDSETGGDSAAGFRWTRDNGAVTLFEMDTSNGFFSNATSGMIAYGSSSTSSPGLTFKADQNTGFHGSSDSLFSVVGGRWALWLKELSSQTQWIVDYVTKTASATQTQGQAKTESTWNLVSGVVNDNDVITLYNPANGAGHLAFITNASITGNTLQVYPDTGDTIAGEAVNASVFIKQYRSDLFISQHSGLWHRFRPMMAADDIDLVNLVGTPDYETALDYLNVAGQVGTSTGGVVTDNGDGTVAVTEWHGWLRSGGATSDLYSAKIAADASLAVTDNVVSYIYAEYNAGTPQFAAYTAWQTDRYGKVWIASVHRTGTAIHVTTSPSLVPNFTNLWTDREATVYGIVRESGGITSESGTRNIAITAGEWWLGVNEFSTTAKDTAVADTFSYYYRDGLGGYTEVTAQTQINNTQYDDGSGTLATLTNNRYGVHWVYTAMDDDVYVVYGRGDYTLVQAEAATPPSDVPDHVVPVHGLLIAKIIVRKSASTFTSVQNPFSQVFTMSGAIDHGELAGLTDDDHTQYLLADGSRVANPKLVVTDGTVWTTDGLHLDETNQAGFLGDDFGIKIYAGGGRYIGYWDDTGLAGKFAAKTFYIVGDASASATTPIYTFSSDNQSGIGANADNMVSLIGLGKEIARVDGTLAAETFSIRGGYTLKILDPTNAEGIFLWDDGTTSSITMGEGRTQQFDITHSDSATSFIGTGTHLNIDMSSGGGDVRVRTGTGLSIWDAGNADAIVMQHDGTDMNFEDASGDTREFLFSPDAAAALGGSIGGGMTGTHGIVLSSVTNADILHLSVYNNEGVNNRRASLFMNDSTGEFGLTTTASSGVAPFALYRGTRRFMYIDDSTVVFRGSSATDTPKVALQIDDGTERAWMQYTAAGGLDIDSDANLTLRSNNADALNFDNSQNATHYGDSFTGSSALASSKTLQWTNTDTGTASYSRIQVTGDDTSVALFAQGTNVTSPAVTGGPTGQYAVLRVLSADPLGFATNNTERIRIGGDGDTIAYSLFHAQANFGFKAVDQAKTTATTLAADNDLDISLLQAGWYRFTAYVRVDSADNTPDFKWDWAFTGTLTSSAVHWSVTQNSTPATLSDHNADVTINERTDTNTVERQLVFTGYIDVSTAGDFRFRWSQETSSASHTTVRAGSWLRVERMGDT